MKTMRTTHSILYSIRRPHVLPVRKLRNVFVILPKGRRTLALKQSTSQRSPEMPRDLRDPRDISVVDPIGRFEARSIYRSKRHTFS